MKLEIKTVDKKLGIVRVTTTDERWYEIDGKFVPSVTWICSSYPKGIRFYKWLAEKGWDEAEAIKQTAGNRGSKVHQACEDILKGKPVKHDSKYMNYTSNQEEELTPQEYGCVMSFVEWLDETKPEIKAIEYIVHNKEEGYAGTVDLKCMINGQLYIVDLKTSPNIWPEYELQLSAYKRADEETKNFSKLAILQLGYERNKTKKYKFTEVEDKYGVFLSVKNIWANETAGVAPLQKDYPLEVSWKMPKKVKVKVKTTKKNVS